MTARRDLNPQDEKRDRTLVAGTVNGKGMGVMRRVRLLPADDCEGGLEPPG